MHDKVKQLQETLDNNDELRWRLNESVAAFNGDKSDNRAVFEAIIAPIAWEAGIALTYDEVIAVAKDGAELTDDELDAVAGGVGSVYQRVVCGALAATTAF